MQRTCRELEALLGDFAGGESAASERRELQTHLAECAACREALRELRWIDALLSRSLREAPVEHLLTLPGGAVEPRLAPRVAWVRPAFAAAAAGLLVFFIWGMVRGFARGRPQGGSVAQSGLLEHGEATRAPQTESASEARQWADLQAAIEREASAARLAASAEALIGQAATDGYALESLRLVANTFPETRAGIDAARRVESLTQQRKEHQP
jgi:anti-sigma factor RsiW